MAVNLMLMMFSSIGGAGGGTGWGIVSETDVLNYLNNLSIKKSQK